MSEYWKSTPKYWCKFCTCYVRDTPQEKKQHEASPKHQGGIQRSLKNLHKEKDRAAKDEERAKAEVQRLNGIVGDGKSQSVVKTNNIGPSNTIAKTAPTFTQSVSNRATIDDRRKQAEQLYAMGVAVPDEFRRDLSVASAWTSVSEKVVYQPKEEEIKDDKDESINHEDTKDASDFASRNVAEDDEENTEMLFTGKRKKIWGKTVKTYPGASESKVVDFDVLMAGPPRSKVVQVATVKREESSEEAVDAIKDDVAETKPEMAIKIDDADDGEPPIVFKKRKIRR